MSLEAENKKSGFFSRLFKGSNQTTSGNSAGKEDNIAGDSDANHLNSNSGTADSHAREPITESVNESLSESVGESLDNNSNIATDEASASTKHESNPSNSESLAVPIEDSASKIELESAPDSKNWFKRMQSGLSRSSSAIAKGISDIVSKKKLNDEMLEELEEILIRADLGIDTASAVTANLTKTRFNKEISDEEVKRVLANEIESVLDPLAIPLKIDSNQRPHVILVVGVNGTGKTTTIGKLASKFKSEGKVVNLVAGDTFRAAAVEQLKIWGQRTESHVFAKEEGGDAAGLVFDAMQGAVENGVDVLLIDTAGRLQNKDDLMEELKKIIRVIKKQDNDAPHSVLLTLDATTGQNALSQVEVFGEVAGVNGLVMTKLDGTARGGILVSIARKFKIPVHFIGVGEKIEDLETFSARDFSRAIAGLSD